MFENIQSNEMAMDDELTASASTSENVKVSSKTMDDMNAIKLYVDDDDEENENECLNIDWPKVPNILPSVAQIEASNHKANNENNFSINNLNASNNSINNTSGLDSKLDKILDLLSKQSSHINHLEHQIKMMEKNISAPKKESGMSMMDLNLAQSMMQEQAERYERILSNELDQVVKKQANHLASFKDSLTAMLNKTVSNQLTDKMSSIFVADLQRNILSLISNELETIKQQIHFDVNRKLSVSDQLLRENLMLVCTNKNFLDTMSHSVQNGVQQTVNNVFLDSVNKAIIPAYDRATKEMFKQVNDMFQRGVANCE